MSVYGNISDIAVINPYIFVFNKITTLAVLGIIVHANNTIELTNVDDIQSTNERHPRCKQLCQNIHDYAYMSKII